MARVLCYPEPGGHPIPPGRPINVLAIQSMPSLHLSLPLSHHINELERDPLASLSARQFSLRSSQLQAGSNKKLELAAKPHYVHLPSSPALSTKYKNLPPPSRRHVRPDPDNFVLGPSSNRVHFSGFILFPPSPRPWQQGLDAHKDDIMHTNKHKSKSKSHRWGAWSEWTWDSSQQANFRVRQDSQGHLDYEWDQQDLNQPGHSRTPREAPVEDITDRLNCLSTTTNEAHFELPDDYAAYAGEAPPEQAKAKKTKLKSKDKEKPKSHRRHASSDGKSSAASQDDTAHPHSPGLQFVESAHGDEYQQQAPTANVNYSQYGSGRVAYSSAWPSRARRYAAFTDESEAAASSSQTSSTTAAQQYAGDDFDGAAAPPRHGQVRSESDGGSPTPQQSETAETADADYMPEMAENGETELDPRYQIEHSARFQPGEIFKVHWSEPQGSMSEKPKSSSSSSSSSKKQDLENKFGTKFFVGFRRFIVVANDQGHCTCVPILTYGGKGCKKHGVKPEKHGIVCERGGPKPKRLDGEPALGFAPVRVEMTEAGERLARESRVNYSKLVTVEHNVKVFFIGHVYPGDWQIVGDAVNYCWNKKIHQKQQRHK